MQMTEATATRPTTLGAHVPGHHLYELGVLLPSGHRETILVHARSRVQADAMARRAGYTTLDCNMVG
jgi:hypothetical protein